ncbi:MAG: transporter substrate-binding domain-containing protein [Chloroflexi bacterium]|nr:transporter substrate-binding domain-containing protein [Chloroflexota bacterium]
MLAKRKISLWLLVVAVLTAVSLLVACSGADPKPTIAPTAEVPPPVITTPTADATGDDSWSSVQAAGKLVIGASFDYPPFEYYTEDFKQTGYDVALINEIGKLLGVEVEISDMAFDGLGDALLLGQIDAAISAISVTEARDAVLDFSNVYYVSEDGILAQKQMALGSITNAAQIAPLRVGVQRGSAFADWIQDELIEPGLMSETNLFVYLQAGDAVRDLRQNRLDLVIGDLLPAQVAVGAFDDIELVGQGLNLERYAIALPPGAAALQTKLNEALITLQNSGRLAELAAEYLNLNPDEVLPVPTPDPNPQPTPVPPPAPACRDGMTFVQDLNFDDQNMTAPPQFAPGQPFQKSWRILNSGTCIWDSTYTFVFAGGNVPAARMGGQPQTIQRAVAPGQTYDVSVDLVSPLAPGTYQGFWTMRNPTGLLFGNRVWVGIQVIGAPTPTPAPTQTPTADVNFTVDRTTIRAGECVTFSWNVSNIQAVFFYPQGANWQNFGVTGQGTSVQCPAQTTTYELRVLRRDNTFDIRQITIFVEQRPGAPVINRFTVDPNQINVGQCVAITWQVSGSVNTVRILRGGSLVWDGAPISGSTSDCPPGNGRIAYVIEAVGPGGTSREQRDITIVQPTPQPIPPTATPPIVPTATPQPPIINSFVVSPGQITTGQCVNIAWNVSGGTNRVNILRNGSPIIDGASFSGAFPDCLNQTGTFIYRLEATGSGQTITRDQTVTVSAAVPPTPTRSPLVGVNWTLANMNMNQILPVGLLITAVFDDNGRVNGSSGCNTFNGSYSASGNNLTIGPLTGTNIACDETTMQIEQQFLTLFQSAATYNISANGLIIFNSNGQNVLNFNQRITPR